MKTNNSEVARLSSIVLFCGVIAYVSIQWGSMVAMAEEPDTATLQGFAVVELFTSEGCSSCPPADRALRQIADAAAKTELPIHVLSFHVDYWNRLGWTDPFSDAGYTRRQKSYAGVTGASRTYTPQMIVNGTFEFVGSDRAKANVIIPKVLRQSAQSTIRLKQTVTRDGWTLQYKVDGANQSDVLHLALVETPDATSVSRGENAGRKLYHVNVVRRFESVSLDSSEGQASIVKPSNFSGNESRIIAYVQDPRTGQITGASAVKM